MTQVNLHDVMHCHCCTWKLAYSTLTCWDKLGNMCRALQERIEPALLSALDSETDGQIAEQLRAMLQVLLLAGAPSAPAYWLAVLSDVALAAPAPAARRNDAGASQQQPQPAMIATPPEGSPLPSCPWHASNDIGCCCMSCHLQCLL